MRLEAPANALMATQYPSTLLFVDITSIAYAHHQNAHALILDIGNDPMIADPVFP